MHVVQLGVVQACLTRPVLGATAVALDRDVRLVRDHVRIREDEPVPDDKAGARALALGVVLPGQEVVWPE